VALVIVALGVRYYLSYQRQVRETASAELRAVRVQLETGTPTEAVERLRNFLVQFGDTEYALEARVLLAYSLLLSNRPQEAIEAAREAAMKLGEDPVANRAAFLLASAYEEVGDTANAISVYEEIGAKVEARVQKTRALEAAARLQASSGNHEAAARLYDRLAQMTPETAPARTFYEMRAAEMRAEELRVGPPTGSEETG
jgi:tetratricopeptide (TPR) repeat protein